MASNDEAATEQKQKTVGHATKMNPLPKGTFDLIVSITRPNSCCLPAKLADKTKIPGSALHKRPLVRRPLPASSKDRLIYVSSGTPFMSAVKRVRKQLGRSLGSGGGGGGAEAARRNASLHARIESLQRDVERGASSARSANDEYGATVTLVGTGKAVEKTLSLASWFEQQADCRVAVRTGTVATVDDVVSPAAEAEAVEQGVEDENRLRRLSCLQVVVSLK